MLLLIKGKVARYRSWISFRPRLLARFDSFFSYIFYAMINELCIVGFAVVGIKIGLNFFDDRHIISLRFDNNNGCCVE